MMLKNNKVLIPIALFSILVVWMFFSEKDEAVVSENSFEITEEQSSFSPAKFVKQLKKKIQTAQQETLSDIAKDQDRYSQAIWSGENDFYEDLYPEVENDPRSYFESAQKIAKTLSKCLAKEDLCGQKNKLENDKGYSSSRTPFHFTLERSLSVMNLAIRTNPYLWSDVDFDVMLDVVKTRHSNSAILATQISVQGPAPKKFFKDVLKESRFLSSRFQPTFFTITSQSNHMKDPELRKDFVSSISQALKRDNDTLIYSLQKKIYRFDLNQKEAKSVIKSVCHLKNKEGAHGEPNRIYKKVRRSLDNQMKYLGYKIKVDKVCGRV